MTNETHRNYRVWITPKTSIVAAPEHVGRALAKHGLPVCPGELDDADAVPAMLAELRDLGRVFASERCD